jgi:hypothetical protein
MRVYWDSTALLNVLAAQNVLARRKGQTLDWPSAHVRRASWDWKSGPAKARYR